MPGFGIALNSTLPPVAVLEMTWYCNHACLFCGCPWYADIHDFDTDTEMSVEDWCRAIDDIVRSGVTEIAFTGGECLLKPHLRDIISHSGTKARCRVPNENGRIGMTLLSNGRALSEDWLSFLQQYDVRLSISLPGLEALPHLVGADTTADHILHWFRRAKDHGLRTNAAITVTKVNQHELYETIAESLFAGADTILLNRFLPGGRGLVHRDLELNADEVVEMLDIAETVLRKAGRYGSIGTEIPACTVGDVSRFRHLSVSTTCGAAKGFFAVGPDGGIRVCNHSPVVCGHVNHLDDLVRDSYWWRFVERDYLPMSCAGCKDAVRCDGGCREAAHVMSGSVDAEDSVMNIRR